MAWKWLRPDSKEKINAANQRLFETLGKFCFHTIGTCKYAGNANY
jgi:hypothetical protein